MKALFLWPQEPYTPTSLFKHYVYLGEVAAHARKDAEITIIDLSVEQRSKKELSDEMRDADAIFTIVEPYTVRSALGLAELARQTSKATTVAYGTAPAFNPGFFSPHFDAVLRTGHWEKATEKLLTRPEEFFRESQGNIYGRAEPLPSEEWPHPPLDLLPLDKYFSVTGSEQVEIGVQKGCTFSCAFCAEKSLIGENRIFARSPESIGEYVKSNPGRSFYLDATTFTQDRQWAEEVCDRIRHADDRGPWKTVTRIDQIDEDIVKKMSAAGCEKIGFGIETFSKNLQRSIRKNVDYERAKEASRLLIAHGITPRAFLILGLPGQTADDVLTTQELIQGMGAEYRWKEYVPFENIPAITSVEGFDAFARPTFRFHDIPGLDKGTYLSLLGVRR
jgi:radical SAM superfamily enzyme YgiQ (UPF0313 family)